MKSQEQNISKSQEQNISNNVFFNKQKEQRKQYKIQCIGQNKGIQYCVSKQCNKEILIICDNQQCKCHVDHQKCIKISLQSTFKEVKSQIINSISQLQEQISKGYDKLIDKISDQRDKLIQYIKKQIKYSQLTQYQKLLLLFDKNHQNQSFSYQQSSINQNFQIQTQIIKHENQIKKDIQINKILKNINIQTKQQIKVTIFQYLRQSLYQFQNITLSIHQHLNKFFYIVKDKLQNSILLRTFDSILLNQNSILKNIQQTTNLRLMLPKQLKEIKLLHKSIINTNYQNSCDFFNVKDYLQKYGQQTNTLFICKSDKGKIMGAYSPLSLGWNSIQNKMSNWMEDKSMETFIYSLSQNHKFRLICANKAIYRAKDMNKIQFGQGQFMIYNKKNDKNNCCMNIHTTYEKNINYKNIYDALINQRLNGTDSKCFRLQQIQIWKVILEY